MLYCIFFISLGDVTNLVWQLSKVSLSNNDKTSWNYVKLINLIGKITGSFAGRYLKGDSDYWIVENKLPARFGGWIRPSPIAYFEEMAKQHLRIVCTNPKECSEEDCDPYKSMLTSKPNASCSRPEQNIRKPDIKGWKSNKAFAKLFLYVSILKLKSIVPLVKKLYLNLQRRCNYYSLNF